MRNSMKIMSGRACGDDTCNQTSGNKKFFRKDLPITPTIALEFAVPSTQMSSRQLYSDPATGRALYQS